LFSSPAFDIARFSVDSQDSQDLQAKNWSNRCKKLVEM
jgi:hypothetical protein